MRLIKRECLLLPSFVCPLAAVLFTPVLARAQMTEVVLHNFQSPPRGANPYAGVIRDSKGNLYGTTFNGGAYGYGVVYKLDPAGHEAVLYSFTGATGGAQPEGGVIRDSPGNLYGTTYEGGSSNAGVVYMLSPGGRETVLHSFTSGPDGGYPVGGLLRDSSGNLYGAASAGGPANKGVIYKLDASGIQTVLYSFTGTADGAYPNGDLIRDSAGNIYGTTNEGGLGAGVVFKLDSNGHEMPLYSFTGGADGAYPGAGVIRDSSGNLYGTTQVGGTSNLGVVYKVDATGHETVLHSFSGGADGVLPVGRLALDAQGNIYGATQWGSTAQVGLVFKLDRTGHESVLYSFSGGADGGYPYAGVIRDSAGNLYGTTYQGGNAAGVVFRLDSTGYQTVLYSFSGGADGCSPESGLTADVAGNLYGTTFNGGPANAGTVFKVDTSGHETVLYSFTGQLDGAYPNADLILDRAGNLYGTTSLGGSANFGTVFKLDSSGHETVVHNFTAAGDGAWPMAGLTLDAAGNLYGTTSGGGSWSYGVVFKLKATGQETILYSFSGGLDGQTPNAGVVRDSAGNLYGTTTWGGIANSGAVYMLDTNSAEKVVYSFSGGTDGGFPWGGVVRDAAGNLYGTASLGGSGGYGVVFKLDPAGRETVLYNFAEANSVGGSNPRAGVILDSAGNLYGTTQYGGGRGYGVIYQLDPTGNETVLYSFTGGADGAYPYGGVIRTPTGIIYGTASAGGAKSGGTVFKLKP